MPAIRELMPRVYDALAGECARAIAPEPRRSRLDSSAVMWVHLVRAHARVW